MGLLLPLLLSLAVGQEENSAPNVWIAPPKGRLERSGRNGDGTTFFDVYPDVGSLGFRNRQLAFVQGGIVSWITAAGGTAHGATQGQQLIGWSSSDPILWDGHSGLVPSGAKVSLPLQEGESPVFAVIQNGTGLLVSQSGSGLLRLALLGEHPMSANFGMWRLAAAHLATPTSGLLLLAGNGYAVVRIGRGRAEMIDVDPVQRLGIGLSADRRSYVLRHTHNDDQDRDETEVSEVVETGPPLHYCTLMGDFDLVDLDRAKGLLYLVRRDKGGAAYVRVDAQMQQIVTLREKVKFVMPAFGGVGFVPTDQP